MLCNPHTQKERNNQSFQKCWTFPLGHFILSAENRALCLWLFLPYYSRTHTSLCCTKLNNSKVSLSRTGVPHYVIFLCEFSCPPRLHRRMLDIRKFEKPLILPPSNSHAANLITHSVWNDILKEPELWQVALCHHYSRVTPTRSCSLRCAAVCDNSENT